MYIDGMKQYCRFTPMFIFLLLLKLQGSAQTPPQLRFLYDSLEADKIRTLAKLKPEVPRHFHPVEVPAPGSDVLTSGSPGKPVRETVTKKSVHSSECAHADSLWSQYDEFDRNSLAKLEQDYSREMLLKDFVKLHKFVADDVEYSMLLSPALAQKHLTKTVSFVRENRSFSLICQDYNRYVNELDEPEKSVQVTLFRQLMKKALAGSFVESVFVDAAKLGDKAPKLQKLMSLLKMNEQYMQLFGNLFLS